MHRRLLLVSLAAGALAPALGRAAPGVSHVPLADAFLLLDAYLALPPADRSRFTMAYRVVRDGHADTPIDLAIVDGANRTPVAVGADGFITALPTLAQLKGKATFEVRGGPVKFGLELQATMPPATRIDAAELAQTLAQVNAAVIRFADGARVGRLDTAYFPGADAGHAVLADARTQPLPVFTLPPLGALPYFEASKFRGATAVVLQKPPSRVFFAGPPRK